MGGNLRPEDPCSPPPSNIGRHPELARSEVNNGNDIRRRSLVATPDDCTTWTEEKHKSYLCHLETSFVKQLHQSKMTSALAKCSDQSQGETQKGSTNVRNSSEKFKVLRNGCWQNNYIRDAPRELWSTVEHGKRTISPGFAMHSHECSSTDPSDLGDLFDIEREGTGQNFLDGVDECTTKLAKRSKTEFVDESSQAVSLAYKRLLEHT